MNANMIYININSQIDGWCNHSYRIVGTPEPIYLISGKNIKIEGEALNCLAPTYSFNTLSWVNGFTSCLKTLPWRIDLKEQGNFLFNNYKGVM